MALFEPPEKRMKLDGEFTSSDPVVDGITEAVVRFDNAVSVHSALAMNGTELGGSPITVTVDMTSKDGTKIIVRGFGPHCMWQELKDHFKGCGTVAHADVKGQSDKGKGRGFAAGFVASPAAGFVASPAFAGSAGSAMPGIGEVRMSTAEEAAMAVSMLNGSQMSGSVLSVQQHGSSKDGTKLQVSGIPPGAAWQELKDLFASCGTVMHADVAPVGGSFSKGSGSKGFPRVPGAVNGTVRFADPVAAQMAIAQLNGAQLCGAQISVAMDWNSLDGTKLFVAGIAPETGWQELKDLFSQCGPVAFCNVGKGKGKGQGKDVIAN